LSTVASLTSPIAPEKRTERRQVRRAGISLQVRVRTADFNDGNFDEVRVTQNASRKAIYFFTKLDRYYKGMRVRVTSPYEPNAGSTNLEQVGEVARVHRRDDGYGVAIIILAGAQLSEAHSFVSAASKQSPNSLPTAVVSSAPSERRCVTRLPFIAPVELVEMRTGSCIQARTSDLSLQGCYVDTLNPLPVGAAVRIQIHRSGATLDVLANVSSRHVGSGMGLVFSEITEAQRTIVDNWLNELGLPRTVFDNPFPTNSPSSLPNKDYAIRLVQVLLRKGVLTQSEASEILSEGT
jgi:hypothetical protein